MKTLIVLAAVAWLSVAAAAQESQPQNRSLTEADQLQIAVQKICPVSGEPLGSKGEPVQVQVEQQVVFLCCADCQTRKLNAQHWKSVQANLAEAQGTCPIMGKPVDATMASTVVAGQRVFVCCPPCIPKIQADVEGSLKKVNAGYAAYVARQRQAASDRLQATAQGICPVTGKQLGSMGTPVKVKVGPEEVAFLCCQSCVGGQIQSDLWKTVQNNLAAAQKTCLVMGKPVTALSESTVINGRRIFVCCPPCIEKIQADPPAYIAQLDAMLAGDAQPPGSGSGPAKSIDDQARPTGDR